MLTITQLSFTWAYRPYPASSASCLNLPTSRDYTHRTCLLFDTLDDAQNFKNNFKNRNEHVIRPNDKVYFGTKCSFPALLLNRININLKRTTQIDKADVIVSDIEEPTLQVLHLFGKYQDRMYGLSTSLSKVNSDLQLAQNSGLTDIKYGWNIPNLAQKEFLDMYDAHPDYVTTRNFIRYVMPQLPTLNDDEFSQIVTMLQSPDKESYKAAIDICQYYNLNGRINDIYYALVTCTDKSFLRDRGCIYTTAERYLNFILSKSPAAIAKEGRWVSALDRVSDFLSYSSQQHWLDNSTSKYFAKVAPEKLLQSIKKTLSFNNLDLDQLNIRVAIEPNNGQNPIQCNDVRFGSVLYQTYLATLHEQTYKFLNIIPVLYDAK